MGIHSALATCGVGQAGALSTAVPPTLTCCVRRARLNAWLRTFAGDAAACLIDAALLVWSERREEVPAVERREAFAAEQVGMATATLV